MSGVGREWRKDAQEISFYPHLPHLFFPTRLKNLSNVRFGRLNRRIDEERGRAIVDVMDRAGLDVSARERVAIIRGAKEKDLAHSGLADTMIDSFGQLMEERRRIMEECVQRGEKPKTSLRLAAFRLAINKVASVENKRGHLLGG